MSRLLRISDAAVLAIHACGMLAHRDEPLGVSRLATAIDVSETHLSKVMQRLTKAGLLSAVRGPKGGYQLARLPDEICVLEIWETIDGGLGLDDPDTCLADFCMCTGSACALRGLVERIREDVVTSLSNMHLHDLDLGSLLSDT